MNTRGRLTIPDVVMALATMFMLGALWPVAFDAYTDIQSQIGRGVELLIVAMFPLLILVLYYTIFRTAVAGVGR